MDAPLILIPRDGRWFDRQGNPYNELGQRLDDEGNVVAEPIDELEKRRDEEIKFGREEEAGVERHHSSIARHQADQGVDQYGKSVARHVTQAGVDRHPYSVDRHLVQKPRTLADFNSFAHFYANQSAIRSPSVQRNDYQRDYSDSTYQTPPPQSSDSGMVAMLAKLLEGQQRMTEAFNKKLDSMYADLNGKLEALGTHLEELDVQVAEAADSIKWQEELLNTKTDPNPKCTCNAIPVEDEGYLDEFKAIFGTAEHPSSDEEVVSLDATEHQVSIDTEEECRSTGAEIYDYAIVKQVSIDTKVSVDRHQTQKSPKIAKSLVIAEENVYKPPVPFPRARESSQKVEEALSMSIRIANPPKKPRCELPILISNPPAFVNKSLNCEKTVSHSCKQRVSRKLGFSIDVFAGKRSHPPKGKLKRTSKPFAKIKIIIPSDLEEKGEEVIQQMMENTMKLFPGIVFDKSGGAAKKGRTKDRAATILTDKGGTTLPEDPNA